ncbi:MAG TPA: cytochrome c-type biogenesis protein [Allosphingosinicella sp.]|nr:cytochrome c-type biogenesis protein [Allosphingosinicella sp.]
MRALAATAMLLLLLASPGPAAADSLMPAARWANVQLPDADQERRAKALMETVRCLVCQGQSVADSNAEMAGDMRSIIRERIQAGQTPDQIRGWLISRYGEAISYAPQLDARTALLFAMPLILLLAGFWLVRGRFRRKRKA